MEEYVHIALEHEHNKGRRMAEERKNHTKPCRPPQPPPDVFGHPAPVNIAGSFDKFQSGEDIVVTLHDPVFSMVVKDQDCSHQHDFFEFNYVYSGSLTNYVDHEAILQDENTLLLMNPFVTHDPKISNTTDIVFNILIRRNWIDDFFLRSFSSNSLFYPFFFDSVYGVNRRSSYLMFQVDQEIAQVLHQMIAAYYDHEDFYQQVIVARMLDLLVLLTRQKKRDSEEHNRQLVQRSDLSAILSYIRHNFASATLQSVADEFGYSTSYLSRLIKKHTQHSFLDIIRDIKLKNAANYLIYSRLTIEKINEIIGYNDTSYFNKVFRQEYGMTPSQYRKRYASDFHED